MEITITDYLILSNHQNRTYLSFPLHRITYIVIPIIFFVRSVTFLFIVYITNCHYNHLILTVFSSKINFIMCLFLLEYLYPIIRNWPKNQMHTNRMSQKTGLYACLCMNSYNMKTKRPTEKL